MPFSTIYGYWITTLAKLPDGMVVLKGWTIAESKELAHRSIAKDAKITFENVQTRHYETETHVYVLEPLRSGVLYHLGTDKPVPFKWTT